MLWRLTKPNFPGCVEAPATSTPRGSNSARKRSVSGPAGAGHQRTSTSASTATGRPSTTSSGLRSADARSSRSVAARDNPSNTSATRRPVDRRLAAELAQQGLERQVVDHLLGVDRLDRHQPEAHVGHRLGQDAADAEHDRHAELRVVVEPRDQLAGGPQHRRHQQVDITVVGRRRRQERPGSVAHLLGRPQAEPNQPPLGLVGDAHAAQLDDDRVAEGVGGADRVVGGAHDPFRRKRHPEGPQQLLGCGLREGRHGRSG